MVFIVGHSLPIRPLTEQERLDRFEDQKALYDGVSLFLEKRGPKPLETSMYAPGNYVPVKHATGLSAARRFGRFLKNKHLQHLKKNGQHYVNIAKDFTGKDIAIKDIAIKDIAIKDTATESNIANKDEASVPFVATVQDLTKSAATTPKGPSRINPEAKEFVPRSVSAGSDNANHGLTSNDDFMEHVRSYMAKGTFTEKHGGPATKNRRPIKPRDLPARVLLFKNVPDWLNISDIFGLVYGGAVEHIFRSHMAEITVIFCEEATCATYLAVHANGIRIKKPGSIDEHVIMDVEKAPRGEEITSAMQKKLATGASRLVRVDGVFHAEKYQALSTLAMRYELDHIQFHCEKDKAVPAFFFFCGIADAWAFEHKLKDSEEWENHTTEFVADPCKAATGFHGNAVPNEMVAAVVAAAAS
ncbi:uncharacterized protein N7496_010796 [Penicillium cataractarum]|uniref:Uncharacterized protein n=1 Tax=Penicillium cataractarum TaxID=2100454 RepID=A0A9W9RDS6_9EURO|nr:uncharacterized protein N7496_010796 [Penicillium cataractarum]KAJ5358383.1 hypothetical protein N7496_010796 [Penicillium cataractarum]